MSYINFAFYTFSGLEAMVYFVLRIESLEIYFNTMDSTKHDRKNQNICTV